MIQVLNVFDLMSAGQFVRHEECRFLKYPDVSSTVVLFSHRWETRETPDPTGIQYHGAVRFAIQLCMMAYKSCPNVFNSVDFSEMTVNPQLLMWLFHELDGFRCNLTTYTDVVALRDDEDLFQKAELLEKYLIETIGCENVKLDSLDILIITWLMRKIDFWYDYSCMPQKHETDQEKEAFNRELQELPRYFQEYWTCINWSTSSLKRCWCLLEGLISMQSDRDSLFCAENSEPKSQNTAIIYERNFMEQFMDPSLGPLEHQQVGPGIVLLYRHNDAVNRDLSKDLTFKLQVELHRVYEAIRDRTEEEILTFFKENGYSTTEEKDMAIVAGLLASYFKQHGS